MWLASFLSRIWALELCRHCTCCTIEFLVPWPACSPNQHSAFVGLSQKIGRCLPKAKRKPERYNNLIFRGKGRDNFMFALLRGSQASFQSIVIFGVNMLHSSTGRRDWGAFVQCPRNSYCGDPGAIRREEISALWKEVSLPGTILACNAKSSLPSPCYSHKAFSGLSNHGPSTLTSNLVNGTVLVFVYHEMAHNNSPVANTTGCLTRASVGQLLA